MILVERNLVYFMSKDKWLLQRVCIEQNLCVTKSVVEEIQAVRYMLHFLGLKVRHAILICGDNKGVIQNCTLLDSLLKKRHVAK